MPRPILPLECLYLIFAHLAKENDTATLAKLLRVNRCVCEATLPFLYKDPTFIGLRKRKITYQQLREKSRDLVQTLLRQVPPDQCPELLRVIILECLSKDIIEKHKFGDYSPVIDYLSHLRHLHLLQYQFVNFYDYGYTAMEKYIKYCANNMELKEKYLADATNHFEQYNITNFTVFVETEIKRQLIWTLCNRSTIQSLSIPLSDVKRYLDCVHEFKSLSSVTFVVDKDFLIPQTTRDRMAPEHQRLADELERKYLAAQEDLVQFVHEHAARYKDVLQEVTTSGYPYEVEDIIHIPIETFVRAVEALPPLKDPRILDRRNWIHFNIKAQDTNLESVESMFFPQLGELGSSERDPPIHRCRTLKELEISEARADTFQWAVNERNQYEHDLRHGLVPRPLIPLRKLTLEWTDFSPQVANDAVFAFNDTLKDLTLNINYWPFMDNGEPAVMHLGQGWNLSKLIYLRMYAENNTFHLDPSVFTGCEALEDAHIQGDVWEYKLGEIQLWFPADLPYLRNLELEGVSALAFNPATFHSTSNLETLKVSMPPRDDVIYPPDLGGSGDSEMQDSSNTNNTIVEQDPRYGSPLGNWTWDWSLPKLTKLELGSKFAAQFKFQMLKHCPMLEYLSLSLTTRGSRGKRTLTVSDFMNRPPGDEERQWRLNSTEEIVHSSQIRTFKIYGKWHIEADALWVLFHEVMPNIEILEEKDCMGFDVESWMDALKGLKHLVHVKCSQRISE
ncbi:hypothetical protein BGZ50_008951 [Haplosporangium sp. Z 11]|nr:hypothetical protein BGZ50_008951 [Haplosporangium sp. Z 11]